ncbi:hypothetical protein [Aurantibacter sp.]|uniref:hypothetical protein n=1 Tax=Aurantibacter sp. TaxID=2807103 RepID=UPI0032630FD7
MSNKIKSSLFLSCFIAAFTIYNFSITEVDNNLNNATEFAHAELEQEVPAFELEIAENK